MGSLAARLYEPVFGRLLGGVRAACLASCPPRPGMRVLDVGCGTGALLGSYAAAGGTVTGIDTSPAMLAEGRRRLGRGASLVRGQATALPCPDGSADLVMATMLLHSLATGERIAALAEMARVAGDRGRVLIADYRPGRPEGLGARCAWCLAQALEAIAGHLGGVRSLAAAGGAAALAGAVGLVVEGERAAAGGAVAVTRLRSAGAVA